MTIVANTTDVAAFRGDDTEHDDDRSLLNRRVWLAPICLCLVATLHLYRVTTAGQTPWKGGGFGMFSTFDAENARFVRAFLITPEGTRPIEIPSELDKRIAELRAAPNQEGLDTLAKRLTQRTWYDVVAAREAFSARMQATADGLPLDGERLKALRETKETTAAVATNSKATQLIANKKHEHRTPTVPFSAVRVELWKFAMPAGTSNLQAKLLFASQQTAQEESK